MNVSKLSTKAKAHMVRKGWEFYGKGKDQFAIKWNDDDWTCLATEKDEEFRRDLEAYAYTKENVEDTIEYVRRENAAQLRKWGRTTGISRRKGEA